MISCTLLYESPLNLFCHDWWPRLAVFLFCVALALMLQLPCLPFISTSLHYFALPLFFSFGSRVSSPSFHQDTQCMYQVLTQMLELQ